MWYDSVCCITCRGYMPNIYRLVFVVSWNIIKNKIFTFKMISTTLHYLIYDVLRYSIILRIYYDVIYYIIYDVFYSILFTVRRIQRLILPLQRLLPLQLLPLQLLLLQLRVLPPRLLLQLLRLPPHHSYDLF